MSERHARRAPTHQARSKHLATRTHHQASELLFHVSEQAGIGRFEPRAAVADADALVWAIDDARLRNYLVPRDCPRVTYYAAEQTSKADVEQFLGTSAAVLAIEQAWCERLRSCRLYCYHLQSRTFACIDECAGYFVSREPVTPVHAEIIEDPFAELLRRGVDVRIEQSLWPLHDSVVKSSLRFSMIRMRNAKPGCAA